MPGDAPGIVGFLPSPTQANGVDPYAYLRDVLARLPTQPVSHIAELVPHHCPPGEHALDASSRQCGAP